MTVIKCDRCGAIYEKKDKHYGYEIINRLFAGDGKEDLIEKKDLCRACEKKLVFEFMKGESHDE